MEKNQLVVNVEGTTWGIPQVVSIDKTENDFIKRHIDDIGTYPLMDKEKKLKTLKLVWELCNSNTKPISQETK